MSTLQSVLRAIRTLQERGSGSRVSLRSLLAIVPAPPLAVAAAVRTLDRNGFLDARTLRLTLLGFAASHAPSVVVYERRRHERLGAPVRVA